MPASTNVEHVTFLLIFRPRGVVCNPAQFGLVENVGL